MSYPDVVIACIEHKVSLEAFRAIEAALMKHDNNMKDYFGGWLITIIANHSNYLVCDRANTQSVTVRKSGKKTATQLLQCPRNYEFTISSCSEGRTRDVHSSSLLIDVYAFFSDVSLRRQASMTQAEKFPDPFCSRAMLICSIIWLGVDVAGCSAGSVLRWHEVAPYSVSLICIVWSCFYVKLMQIN